SRMRVSSAVTFSDVVIIGSSSMFSDLALSSYILPVDRLRAHSGKHPQLAGERADDIIRCVYCHTDDVDSLFAVGESHSADDIVAVFTEQMVKRFHRFPGF